MKGNIKDDVPTLFAIGAFVSIVASLAHELLGHGVGCVIDGGHITLLTFLVFRCAGAATLADGGGPVGAFVVGCAALVFFRTTDPRSTTLKLFLFTLGALTLLWFWGQTVEESFDGSDDWGHVAADLGWPHQWHLIVGVIGVVGYAVTMRVVGRMGRQWAGGRPMRLMIPYLAATLSAIALGALWHGDRFGSALDGFLTFGLAPIGYLVVIRRVAQSPMAPGVIRRNITLSTSVFVLWTVFALTIACGVGRLST